MYLPNPAPTIIALNKDILPYSLVHLKFGILAKVEVIKLNVSFDLTYLPHVWEYMANCFLISSLFYHIRYYAMLKR